MSAAGGERHALIVLGMHRSGTSLTTRLLVLAGAAAPRSLMPATAENARGYWESTEICRFNTRLLATAGLRWDSCAAIPDSWFTAPERAADLEEALSLLDAEFGEARVIAFKDPRLCLLLPFWRRVLAVAGFAPLVLMALRDPLEVAQSLAARAAAPAFRGSAVEDLNRGLLIWLRHVLDAERHTRDLPRALVTYDALLAGGHAALAPFLARAGLAPLTADQSAAIDAECDQALRHQQCGAGAAVDVPDAALALLRRLAPSAASLGSQAAIRRRDAAHRLLDHVERNYLREDAPFGRLATQHPLSGAALDRLAAMLLPAKMRRGPVALFLSGPVASVGHVSRVEHQVAALSAHGWQTFWLALDDPLARRAIARADLVTVFRGFRRPGLAALARRCRARGIVLVHDVDDLLFDAEAIAAGRIALLDGAPARERARWIRAARGYAAALAAGDAAVLTTGPLAAAAARHAGTCHVVPNALGRRMQRLAEAAMASGKPCATDGLIRILFASGTPSHHRDFAVAAEAAARVLPRHANLRLCLLGHIDPDLFPALRGIGDRIERRPRVAHDTLFAEVARADINLCPLEMGNPFCEAKSEVRWLIAAAVGVPSIASPTEPLRAVITDGVDGLLADDTAAWEAALERLVSDEELRRTMGQAARMTALDRFGFEAWSREVLDAYGALLALRASRPLRGTFGRRAPRY